MSTSRCWAHSVWLILRGVGWSLVIVKCGKACGSVVCVVCQSGILAKYFKASQWKTKEKWISESGAVVPDEVTPESPYPPFPSYNRNESVWSPPPLIPLFSLPGNLHPLRDARCSSTGKVQRPTNMRGWIDTADMFTTATCKILDYTRDSQLICSVFNTPSHFN